MLRINHRKSSSTTTWLTTIAMSLMLAIALPLLSWGQSSSRHYSDHTGGQEIKSPQTAQDHKDLAEGYRKKAAEYRQEIEMHEKMSAEFIQGVARSPKEVGENPYIKEMRLHCEKYIGAAEKLAHEGDEMAKYHTLRAKELEGE